MTMEMRQPQLHRSRPDMPPVFTQQPAVCLCGDLVTAPLQAAGGMSVGIVGCSGVIWFIIFGRTDVLI